VTHRSRNVSADAPMFRAWNTRPIVRLKHPGRAHARVPTASSREGHAGRGRHARHGGVSALQPKGRKRASTNSRPDTIARQCVHLCTWVSVNLLRFQSL